jgi:hypothetical protein
LQQQLADQTQHSHELEQDQGHLQEHQNSLLAKLAHQNGLYLQSQEQLACLAAAHALLQQQLAQALQEYRASDVIALNLRDQVYTLKQLLADLQSKYNQQVSNKM